MLYIKKTFFRPQLFSSFVTLRIDNKKTCPVMDIIIIILGKLTLFSNWKTLHWFLRLLFFSLFFTNKKNLIDIFIALIFFPSLFIIFKFFILFSILRKNFSKKIFINTFYPSLKDSHTRSDWFDNNFSFFTQIVKILHFFFTRIRDENCTTDSYDG